MRNRHFVLVAGVLVTLTVALCLAAPGLALRQALINQLFGPKLVRLEVIEKTAVGGSTDWHIDRGVVVSVNSSQLMLREADGRTQPIPLSASTKVVRFGHRLSPSQLAPHWRVLVTWPATGPAPSVTAPGLPLRQAVINQLFGPKLVRLEVIEKTAVAGSTDWHIDRGVIVSVDSSELTLREADGRMQLIPLSTSTRVIRLGHHLSPSQLAAHWHVLVTWPATGSAQSVDVERIPSTRGTQGFGRSAAPTPSLS